MTALAPILSKLVKLIPLLSSDKPGEVVATAAAIGRTLATGGCTWHDLANVVTAGAALTVRPNARLITAPCWAELTRSERLDWLDAMLSGASLGEWERQFVNGIRSRAGQRRWRASSKQEDILDAVLERAWRDGVRP